MICWRYLLNVENNTYFPNKVTVFVLINLNFSWTELHLSGQLLSVGLVLSCLLKCSCFHTLSVLLKYTTDIIPVSINKVCWCISKQSYSTSNKFKWFEISFYSMCHYFVTVTKIVHQFRLLEDAVSLVRWTRIKQLRAGISFEHKAD